VVGNHVDGAERASGVQSMHSGNDLGASARSLIATANQRGGADNITVVLAEISGNGLPQAHPGEAIHVEDLGSKI
jgi:serine/threonine protein phosphatase PrpC